MLFLLSFLPLQLLLSRAKKVFLAATPAAVAATEGKKLSCQQLQVLLMFELLLSSQCCYCVVAVANIVAATVCIRVSVLAFVFVLNSTYGPHRRRRRYAAALARCGPASSYLISN